MHAPFVSLALMTGFGSRAQYPDNPKFTMRLLCFLLPRTMPAAVQFTNMGRDFQGTLDYVLYTTNSLVPTATLELPDESDIKDVRHKAGLPNEIWSSDHIALLAEFQYKQN